MLVHVKETVTPHDEKGSVCNDNDKEDQNLSEVGSFFVQKNHCSIESDERGTHFPCFKMGENGVLEGSEDELKSQEKEKNCDGKEHFHVDLLVSNENVDSTDGCLPENVH